MALRHLWGTWMVFWLMGTYALPSGEVTVPELSPGEDGKVTLRLAALGDVMEFQLFPDHFFLAPGVHITHVGRDGVDQEVIAALRKCFYSSQEGLAAFSLCKGVQGVFLKGQDRYVVQPLQAVTEQGALGPHVVFKVGNIQNSDSRAGENKPKKINHISGEEDDNRRHMEAIAGEQGEKNNGGKLGRLGFSSTDLRHSKNNPAGTVPQNRHRRFVSSERFVEILLVADTSMVQFYGEDLKLHLLTLMSVASRIYKHPSLKNSVNLVVVKVLIVEDEDSGPEVSDNGGLTLRNFCRWQQKYNPSSDRHPEHYDTAILITRQNQLLKSRHRLWNMIRSTGKPHRHFSSRLQC